MSFHKGINAITFLVLVLVCMECHDFLFVSGEIRCIEREREALLRIKKDLIDDYGALSSWGSEDDKKECCQWKGVLCSNITGNVIALKLHGDQTLTHSFKLHDEWSHDYSFLRGKISPALLELHHLNDLDLGGNDFGGDRIPEFIGSMKHLQHLNLNESSFSGIVPPHLGNLTNLRTLDLSSNSLRSENLDWLSHLSLLSLLDLSDTSISDANWLQRISTLRSLQELYLYNSSIMDVNPSANLFANSSFTSLSVLDLTHNKLTSSTFNWLFNISSSLVRLDLSYNQLDGPIPDAFGKLASLEFLGLAYNMLGHGIPKSLGNLSHLQNLLLSCNQLTGSVPVSLGQLSELVNLDISFNSLEGTISESNFMNLQNLDLLDLSFNPLTVNIGPGWTAPFQLDFLSLAGCINGPNFPAWIRTQSYFTWLDLSYGGISDEMPKWLTEFSSPAVENLNLSHNHITGTVPDFSSKSISIIDLSYNNLSGPIPIFHPSTWFCQLSHNLFSGSISSICTVSYGMLELLDLSDNQLSGELPHCWEKMTNLQVLGLANNNFSGEIPHAFGSLSNLKSLHLGNNNLSGKLPSSMKNFQLLRMIDVGGNRLTGNISAWLGASYRYVTHLSFRRNRFYGTIPPDICSLTGIQMLDLSINNISGKIPECFNNFISLVGKNGTSANESLHDYVIDYALVQWKGQELEHYRRNLRLLKLIDLSSNRLVGKIPEAFSSLKGLISLNLSRNSLTGNIIPDIGQMEALEILDLSRNHLSGKIPNSLAQLNYLSILDLANNNLSGKIPLGTQLQSFNASVYTGNRGLCGLPLPLCPVDRLVPSINNEGENIKEKDGGLLGLSFVEEFGIAMAFGFILGFWGVVGALLLKRSWRFAYFNFLDAVGDWLYVTATIFLRKFRRS